MKCLPLSTDIYTNSYIKKNKIKQLRISKIMNDWFIVLERQYSNKIWKRFACLLSDPEKKAHGCYKSMFLLAVLPLISQKACFAHKAMKHFSLWSLPQNCSLNWLGFTDQLSVAYTICGTRGKLTQIYI